MSYVHISQLHQALLPHSQWLGNIFTIQGIEWKKIFVPEVPVLEMILRGTIMYLVLFTLLRVIQKRESSSMSITDLLVIVLLADASQNAMAGEYRALPDGVVLVCTIIFWSFLLNFISFHVPWFRKLIEPKPLLIIQDGKMQYKNMRKEFITRDELFSIMREQGIEDIRDIKKAYMEPDGQISILQYSEKQERQGSIDKRKSKTS